MKTTVGVVFVAVMSFCSSNAQATACDASCKTWSDKLTPTADSWSKPDRRAQWLANLDAESRTPIKFFFYAQGNLGGLSGNFEVTDSPATAAVKWLDQHRTMLGVPAGTSYSFVVSGSPTPSYETQDSGDGVTGFIINVQLKYGELPFNDRLIRVYFNKDGDIITGVYNPFRVTRLGTTSSTVSSSTALRNVTRAIGSLTQTAMSLVLWDPSESLNATPTTSSVHWKISGIDSTGALRLAFVNASTGSIAYTNPAENQFQTTHIAYGQNTAATWAGYGAQLYEAGGANGTVACNPAAASCTQPASDQSHGPVQYLGNGWFLQPFSTLAPLTLDFWLNYSTSGRPVLTVPAGFPGFVCTGTDCFRIANITPFNNNNEPLTIVVAQNRFTPDGVANVSSVIATQAGPTLGFSTRKNMIDIVGHEYGHRIQQTQARNNPGSNSPLSYAYNEAMMDAHGEINEAFGFLTLQWFDAYGRPTPNNWELNQPEFWECPTATNPEAQCSGSTPNDYDTHDIFIWSWQSPGCNSVRNTRRAVGNVLYGSWKRYTDFAGDVFNSPSDYDFYMSAWATNILRSHYATNVNFPRLSDFYAVTVARNDSTQAVFHFQEWLQLELEALRASSSGETCFQ